MSTIDTNCRNLFKEHCNLILCFILEAILFLHAFYIYMPEWMLRMRKFQSQLKYDDDQRYVAVTA